MIRTRHADRAVFAVLARTGLLRSPTNDAVLTTTKVSIADAIACGLKEPRVIEVLPAAVKHFGQYFYGRKPRWLIDIIAGRYRAKMILGVSVKDCERWLATPTAQAYFDAW